MAKRSSSQSMVVGLAWFTREQWDLLTCAVPDRSELDDTYEQWQASALDAVRMLEAKGQRVEKVQIDVPAMVAWCNAKGVPVIGKWRAEYVSHVLRQRSGSADV